MKRRLKTTQVLLAIGATFFFLAFSPYIHYSYLAGTDFHSVDLGFENPDQDNVCDHLNELKIVGSNGLSGLSFLNDNAFERFNLSTSQDSPLGHIILTLRC
jgi:hypothetical protein